MPSAEMQSVFEEVAFTGRVVYIGYAKEPVAYETRLFVQKELDILGSRNALPADFRCFQLIQPFARQHAGLLQPLRAHLLAQLGQILL